MPMFFSVHPKSSRRERTPALCSGRLAVSGLSFLGIRQQFAGLRGSSWPVHPRGARSHPVALEGKGFRGGIPRPHLHLLLQKSSEQCSRGTNLRLHQFRLHDEL